MKLLLQIILVISTSTLVWAQNEVKIGNQIWMTKNLDVDRFRNGDTIPEAKTKEEWIRANNLGNPIWCYANFNPLIGKLHGRLYNYHAVMDPRGLAPVGWHIPNYEEWRELFKAAGVGAGNNLSSKKGWNKGYWGKAKSNNSTGFSVQPSTYINCEGVFFPVMNDYVRFWTSTNSTGYYTDYIGSYKTLGSAYCLQFSNGNGGNVSILRENTAYCFGYSVRCIKD